jgi:hypothetical protein
MAYLTFEEYVQQGGTLTETIFDSLEKDAEYELNSMTQDRLKTATIIVDDVKYVMTKFINMLNEKPNWLAGGYTSYGNGIENMSMNKTPNELFSGMLYEIAVKYLPIELITCTIDKVEV